MELGTAHQHLFHAAVCSDFILPLHCTLNKQDTGLVDRNAIQQERVGNGVTKKHDTWD